MEKNKFPVRSSNLALRFYVSDGWTQELLNSCLKQGNVSIKHPDDIDPYFTLDVGSSFDIDKLLSYTSKLYRRFDDYPSQTDKEFMEDMNW